MKRLLIATLALFIVGCAHTPPAGAGPLTVSGHFPVWDNAATCGAPVLIAAAPVDASRRVVMTWAGPVAGSDSVYVALGAAWSFTKWVPAGTYTLKLHPANAAGPTPCGDTTFVRVVLNPPSVLAVD